MAVLVEGAGVTHLPRQVDPDVLVFLQISASVWAGTDYPGRAWIRFILYSGGAVMMLALLVMLLVLQYKTAVTVGRQATSAGHGKCGATRSEHGGQDGHDRTSLGRRNLGTPRRLPASEALRRALDPRKVKFTYVPYPADFGPATGMGDLSYEESKAIGAAALDRAVTESRELVVVGGYSAGAAVAVKYARDILPRRLAIRCSPSRRWATRTRRCITAGPGSPGRCTSRGLGSPSGRRVIRSPTCR
ncbi:putative phage holin [Gordonia westfalica]|uniref:PE-PPE domain-containing protein n=1 Tax=Gordonia westfalica TaxID=158898 RepID=A0A1H2DQ25_9ACTN|nr:PE-PPE domain-containing protein [Gordonia westfalica]SDT84949.1 PE-PPE domain-containing protein [Gordonia westfalica]